jgi:hypothetical protein
MIGHFDEFKRIRSLVKQAAVIQHPRPMEIDKIYDNVKDFLNNPGVRDGLERLEKATAVLADSKVKLVAMDEENTGICGTAIDITKNRKGFVDIFPNRVPKMMI